MKKKSVALRSARTNFRSAKARQALKLLELREALSAAGYETTTEHALALGVGRSTAWALLTHDKRTGPSSVVIKRILASPKLPPAARRKVKEYISEKIAGRYGHPEKSRELFRDRFRHLRQLPEVTASL